MKKGVSETFDEHEQDTARRAYSKEVVEGSKRTTKMARYVPEAEIRTESGTRPALNHDAIERHVREKMEDALAAADRISGIEADPHSRPTIEAGVVTSDASAVKADPNIEWTAPPISAASAAALVAITPLPLAAPPVAAPARTLIPAWAVAFAVFGLVLLVSAAGTVGFFLGRRSTPP